MWLFRRFRISTKCRRYQRIIFSALFLVSLSTLLLNIPDINHTSAIDDPRSLQRLNQDEIPSVLNQKIDYKFNGQKISDWNNRIGAKIHPHQFGRGLLDKSKAYNAEGSELQFRTTNNSDRKHERQMLDKSSNVFQRTEHLPYNGQAAHINAATSVQQNVQKVVQQTPNQNQNQEDTLQGKAENLSNRFQSHSFSQTRQEVIRNNQMQSVSSKQNTPYVGRQEYPTKHEQIIPNINYPLPSASTLIGGSKPNQPNNYQRLLYPPQPQKINKNDFQGQQILRSKANAIDKSINDNSIPIIQQAPALNANFNSNAAFAQDINLAHQKLQQQYLFNKQRQHQIPTNQQPIYSQQEQLLQLHKQQQKHSRQQQQQQHLSQQQQSQWQPQQTARKPVFEHPSLDKNGDTNLDSVRKPSMPNEQRHPDIFWPVEVEDAIPEAFSWKEVDEWANLVRTHPVTSMTTGTETKCGRPPNQYVEMGNQIKLCARHKDINYIEIEGELFSYYLSRVLDIKSVPPLVLSQIQRQGTQWSTQQGKLAEASWQDGEIITLMQFLEGFERSRIPKALIKDPNSPPLEMSSPEVQSLSLSDRVYLAQWSDLIVFDYLVGHLDRVTNHQEGVFHHDAKTQRSIWNNQPIHNLAISKQTSVLWFFDNETGFRMGYKTLYHNRVDGDKYQEFHKSMLHSMCVFRSRTVKKIAELYNHPDPFESLMSFVRNHEPLATSIHISIPGSPNDMPEIFKERLGDVYRWMEQCRTRLKP